MKHAKIERLKSDFSSANLYVKIMQWGASLVGFGDVSCRLAPEFKHIPRAVSIAIRHPAEPECIVKHGPVLAYNNQFPEIDEKLEEIQKKVVTLIRFHGFRALAIPPDSDKQEASFISRLYPLFQHKTAATCAGLGWIGKNGLLVTKKYGAKLSWATVLTDAPLVFAKEPYVKGGCGKCRKCVKACPAGAIDNQEWILKLDGQPKIDVKACASQLQKNFEVIGKYICGFCVMACPMGERGEGG